LTQDSFAISEEDCHPQTPTMLSLVPVAAFALVLQPHVGVGLHRVPNSERVPSFTMSATTTERMSALLDEGAAVVARREEVQAALSTMTTGSVVPRAQEVAAAPPKASKWTPDKLRAEGALVVERRAKVDGECAQKLGELASSRDASRSAVERLEKLREEGARVAEARAATSLECERRMVALLHAREQARAVHLASLKADGAAAVVRREAVQEELAEKLPEKSALSAPPPAGFEWGATF
jgi:hypothetical protein